MAKVLIPLAEGFEEIEAVCLIDVLRRAKIEVVIAGVGAINIAGAHDIQIQTECLLSEIHSKDLDMILLPGGWGGTKAMADDPDVMRLLEEMDADKKLIGAICAAPFVLNKAGVLKYNYTCYPSVEEQIREEGYTQEHSVVTDDNIMTSRGPGTAICFGLAIVEKLKDTQTAEALKEGLLAEYC
ncbi:MAG: DJ-1/PfpI family protein [Campylobacterales bacterium]|nr:DJ-1/PfpI family protein [Campylobacterales bacterium]